MSAGRQGLTIWLTGLPGSGKTTTAEALAAAIGAQGAAVECLDGDTLRAGIGRGLGFSREDRMEHVRRAVYMSGLLNKHGVITIVSLITPYEDMRAFARGSLPSYVEVYVDCPPEVCERRDPKGLYAKARRGEIPWFTGVSDPYETPLKPDIVIHTDWDTVDGQVRRILQHDALAVRLGPRPAASEIKLLSGIKRFAAVDDVD